MTAPALITTRAEFRHVRMVCCSRSSLSQALSLYKGCCSFIRAQIFKRNVPLMKNTDIIQPGLSRNIALGKSMVAHTAIVTGFQRGIVLVGDTGVPSGNSPPSQKTGRPMILATLSMTLKNLSVGRGENVTAFQPPYACASVRPVNQMASERKPFRPLLSEPHRSSSRVPDWVCNRRVPDSRSSGG